MRRTLAAFALAICLSACAGSTAPNVERNYARPNLDQVPLRTVDAVVFVAGPPRSADARLDVKTFDPPVLDGPLFSGDEEPATSDALTAAVRRELQAAGVRVRMLNIAGGAPGEARAIATSSTATTAASGAEALDPAATVRSLAAESDADAILVVRAVPVDSFHIDFGTGTKIQTTALGRERVEDSKPVAFEGRLLLGQAFLFDRRTGLRLWTKQVPDFPEGGRLRPNDPFLEYGYVHDPQKGAAPLPDTRARLAAASFAKKMLADFPRATEGTAAARAELDSIDVERDASLARFFDRGHFGLELGTRWSMQRAELELGLGGQPLPPLETGALAPAGTFVLTPRATYLTQGGLELSLVLPIGIAPGSFSRSYFRDNPNPSMSDPDDRAVAVQVNGAMLYGAEATVGLALPMSPRVFLVPSAGPYIELFALDAGPSSAVGDADRLRVGLTGGLDVWLRMAADSSLYARFGGGLRAGLDTRGPLVFGGQLAASLGVFL